MNRIRDFFRGQMTPDEWRQFVADAVFVAALYVTIIGGIAVINWIWV